MVSPNDTYAVAESSAGNDSGVSWGAIFAGAVAAAVVSMLLLMLGLGLGFSAISPWTDEGASAQALGISSVIWLVIVQIVSSAMGGYLAGRLRVKWVNVHDDEVYFRDTAHGFLAWTLATLVAASLIAGSAASVVGSGVQAGASVASGAAGAMTQAAGNAVGNVSGQDYHYYIDRLFRTEDAPADNDDSIHEEVLRIFSRTLDNNGQLSPEDRGYLAQMIAQRTNMSQQDAERRVDEVYGQALLSIEQARTAAREAADTAAKIAAGTALWTFVTLLCGAFFASLAAIFGGRRRDAAAPVNTSAQTARAAR
ncbi:hypothetical protein BZK31_04790 [Pseudomonas floridensis]|uniref:Transmembrane protein n=1 Tax=Pseudomonas floridensis TaxID=1958950 RepID=A0A1X0NBU9_9PSED|nr:hypothetical protein [Pseudomonas floridensis]ORC60937.1 hypothetical protein BZK31_04790 [Pseudomonas floridensis]